MPCSDGLAYDRYMQEEENKQREKGRKELEPLLCSACTALERLGYDFAENPALDGWHAKHKALDAERVLEEARADFERRSILVALKKTAGELSEEEKKLLKKHKYL